MTRIAILSLALALAACSGDSGKQADTDLADLRGRWVVINYWAQWCKPCIKEIPELNLLAQQHPQITVLGVNFDGATGEELAAQVQTLGIAFPILPADPAPQLGVPRPVVLPTTLVLNPDGALVNTLIGPQTLESLANALALAPTAADPVR